MPWLRVDDGFADHPKVVQAGSDAAWMDVCGMCYAARYLTDGFVPTKQVPKLTDKPNPDELAQILVDVGLWEPRPGGFQIHDYLDYNPTREQVLRQRAADLERKARGNSARIPAGFRPESERNPTVPIPIPLIDREKGEEIPELDDETAAKALAYQSAAGRPASIQELGQLTQLDATPAEIGQAVETAKAHGARSLLPYARKILAGQQAGAAATRQARRQTQPAPRPAPEPETPATILWRAAQAELQGSMARATYEHYIAHTQAGERYDHTLQIIVRNEAEQQWIDNRLRSTIERILAGVAGETMHLQVTTKGATPCQN